MPQASGIGRDFSGSDLRTLSLPPLGSLLLWILFGSQRTKGEKGDGGASWACRGVVSMCDPHSRKESEASTGWGRHGEHRCVGQRPPSRPQGRCIRTEAGHVFLTPSHQYHIWHRCCPCGFLIKRSGESFHVLLIDPFSAEVGQTQVLLVTTPKPN